MAPLGAYLGEPRAAGEGGAGPATRLAVSLFEGGFFGAGVATGLRRVGVRLQPLVKSPGQTNRRT